MKIAIHGGSGSLELSDRNFGARFNEDLVHQVVTAHRARARAGSKAQKTRAQVRGGGTKPWRQKGTGRARAGSIRSPIWVGGGRAFAASPRSYRQKVNRKMYRAAMRSILSELLRQERLKVVEELAVERPKTRDLVGRLRELGLEQVLILVDRYDDNLCLAARNLPGVDVLDAREINPVSLLRFPQVLATRAALAVIEEKLA
ncbi:MAG: 50S ribosomal protein L4 [Gammaproteobacteria bacterium]|nr:MAG: 50S ribosomal protein L4 [Gammaproteobacteria bacterium]